MTYEYTCRSCHAEFELFFTSFAKAEPYLNSAQCDCGAIAPRSVSAPLEAHLYGNPSGFSKPSPTKRHSTKLVSSSGNANSAA